LTHLKQGGPFRVLGGRDITQLGSESAHAHEEKGAVRFKVETSESMAQSTALKEEDQWFSKIEDFDIKIYSNFIGFAVQSIMAAQKWESLIELVSKFNTVTCNFYASYLLPFSTFAL
jgi:hypothetical protein